MKAAKTISLVVVSFIVCWLPVTIVYFLIALEGNRNIYRGVLTLTIILSHFNSAIDPIIYAYRIKEVRKVLKNIIVLRHFRSSPDTTLKSGDTGNDTKSVHEVESDKQ